MNSANGKFFFSEQTSNSENGILCTDGTLPGTQQIASVNVFYYDTFAVLNNIIYFRTTGGEFWRSDGTQEGTYRVKDINPTGNDLAIHNGKITIYNGILYFDANDGVHGTELWRSDGTNAGTYMLKDIVRGAASSNILDITAANGKLYFAAFTPDNGYEPWVSDGTESGTQLLIDISPGVGSSYPLEFVALQDRVYFAAGSAQDELWKTDGTTAGTTLANDLITGYTGSGVDELINLNGTLIFMTPESWNSNVSV